MGIPWHELSTHRDTLHLVFFPGHYGCSAIERTSRTGFASAPLSTFCLVALNLHLHRSTVTSQDASFFERGDKGHMPVSTCSLLFCPPGSLFVTSSKGFRKFSAGRRQQRNIEWRAGHAISTLSCLLPLLIRRRVERGEAPGPQHTPERGRKERRPRAHHVKSKGEGQAAPTTGKGVSPPSPPIFPSSLLAVSSPHPTMAATARQLLVVLGNGAAAENLTRYCKSPFLCSC